MKKLLFLIYIFSFAVYAQKPAFDPEKSSGELFQYSEFTELENKNFSFEDVLKIDALKFNDLKSQNHDFGFTSSTYWIKFKLKNSSKFVKKYYLQTARPITDIANLYQVGKDLIIHKSGDQINFSDRDVQDRQTVFSFTLPQESEQDFYLEIKSDGETTNLPLNLYTETEYINSNYKQQLFLGLFYGVFFWRVLFIFSFIKV